jgi:hypothetical protein
MRIYIIGNDGITLCHEPTTTANEGEIAVASNEELHAAHVSGKQLLTLWNALPNVEKRRKVGDRDALIDQLLSAIEMLPEPEPQSDVKRPRNFRRYAELGFVRLLKDELEARGIESKSRMNASGRLWGGKPFSRSALYLMLQNRVDSLLAGMLVDGDGDSMTPSHAIKRGTRYRY